MNTRYFMKHSLLQYLECPDCHNSYSLAVQASEGEDVIKGTLTCKCGSWPIEKGVPRLFVDARIDKSNWESAYRFGEEWNDFSELTDKYTEQFLSWIYPVQAEDFREKIVLDAGCGKGRHLVESKKFGAAEVIGVDLSHAVDVAFRNAGRLPGVHVIQADITRMPLKSVFDYAFSIGVLHHTPDPKASFTRVLEKVKPGGTISAWVYGREGNGWIVYGVNGLRFITSRLPVAITRTIAFFLAVILQSALCILYRPACRNASLSWLRKILPYSEYFCSISPYSFRENFSIVYDHLLPGIAHYIRQEEITSWFVETGLEDVAITRRYKNSWRGFGRKPSRDVSG